MNLDILAEGFSKVEVLDRRVEKIFVPKKDYSEFKKNILSSDLFYYNSNSTTFPYGLIGYVWGAEIWLYKKGRYFTVCSDSQKPEIEFFYKNQEWIRCDFETKREFFSLSSLNKFKFISSH